MIKTRAKLNEIINLDLPGAEIGAASGVFSLEILQWGIKKLYLVDVWQNTPSIRGMASEPQNQHEDRYKQAVERLKDFPNAVFLKGLSSEMAKQVPDGSLGFIYIDACHYYDCVMEDLTVWVPKLAHGGVCACHDYLNNDYEVKKAVHKFTDGKYKVHILPENGSPENVGCYFINR